MDVIQGHWENENDLRNWCFSRQLKVISIMCGWPKIIHIVHALPKKDPPYGVNINHLFRPRVVENDPLHPRMFGNDLPHPIGRSQSLQCYRDRCALEIKIDEKSQNKLYCKSIGSEFAFYLKFGLRMVSSLLHFPKLILWPPLFNEYPTSWGSPECKYMHILLAHAEHANNNENFEQ